MNVFARKQFRSKLIGRCIAMLSGVINPLRRICAWRISSPERMTDRLEKNDVISFDIFDTLVFRTIPHPTDIFELMEEDLKIKSFREKRISAEMEARRVRGKPNGEIDIFDIYDQMASDLPITPSEGIAAEIRMEKKCCYANPYMKTVFNLLRVSGKELIAVSDMYFPANILIELLAGMGYDGFSCIFVSCDCGCSKGTGELQRLVRKKLGMDKRIVHIGDNYRSDVLASRKAGWQAIWYPKKEKMGRHDIDRSFK